MMTLGFIVLIVSLALVEGTPKILNPPSSVNASLNSVVQFNCMCHYCTEQYWLVNNVSAAFNEIRNKGVVSAGPYILLNNSKLYNVSMPASTELNGSTIICVVYNATSLQSSAVYLFVQGLLPMVENPQAVQISSTQVLVSYTPPVTLEGVPILYYTIQVMGGIVVSTTELNYTLQLTNPCIFYNFTIAAWNTVGKGNITILSNVIMYQVPLVTMLQTTEVYINEALEVYIHFQFNATCQGTAPQKMSLVVNQQKVFFCSISATCSLYNVTIGVSNNVSINLTDLFHYGNFYDVTLLLSTVSSISSAIYNFIINTHHIIEGRVLAATLTTVCIECRFRLNAPSSACYIIFNSTHGAAVIRKIEKPVTVSVIHNCFNLIPDGVYSISIIDSQSYKNNLNNTAVVLSSLITISHSTTEMSFFMSSTTLLQYSTSKSEQELYSTPVAYSSLSTHHSSFIFQINDNYDMTSEGGIPLLIIIISGSVGAIITCTLFFSLIILTGYCKTKRKLNVVQKQEIKQSANILIRHTVKGTNSRKMVEQNIQYETLPKVAPVYVTVLPPLPKSHDSKI